MYAAVIGLAGPHPPTSLSDFFLLNMYSNKKKHKKHKIKKKKIRVGA